jgi:hypothetical protein
MGNVGATELLLIGLVLVIGIMPIIALISAALFDSSSWQAAGYSRGSKVLWILLCLVPLLGWLAAIGYFAAVRPKLRKMQSRS